MTDKANSKLRFQPTIIVDHRLDRSVLEGILERCKDLGLKVRDLRLSSLHQREAPNTVGVIKEYVMRRRLLSEYNIGEEIPAIGMTSDINPDDRNTRYVMPDFAKSAELVFNHFYELGVRSFAFIHHDPWGEYKEIYDHFKRLAEANQCQCELYSYAAKFGDVIRAGNPEFADWLKNIPKPLGILLASPRFAASLCESCQQLSWSVPEDIAIACFENMPFYCESSPVPLTAINIESRDLAHRAVQTLYDQVILERQEPRLIRVPPAGLVVRQSTVPESLTLRALRLMRENMQTPITVEDIAADIGVSRRKIERAFRKERQTTVNHELTRIRLARACDLLNDPDLKVKQIARLCGFASQPYFQQVFKKAFGMTPVNYRRKQQK